MKKNLIFLLLMPLFLLGLCTPAQALEMPEDDAKCSLTLLFEYEKEPLSGGAVSLYRVAKISESTSTFEFIEPLEDSGLSLDNLQDKALAQKLLSLAKEHKLPRSSASVNEGKAIFKGLETGLYVMFQLEGNEIPDFAPMDAFLVALPQWQNDAYSYDIVAYPKVSLEPSEEPSSVPFEPTIPSEPSDKPSLPQTGQLKLPVPIMAVTGLGLILLGLKLTFGSKRRDI